MRQNKAHQSISNEKMEKIESTQHLKILLKYQNTHTLLLNETGRASQHVDTKTSNKTPEESKIWI